MSDKRQGADSAIRLDQTDIRNLEHLRRSLESELRLRPITLSAAASCALDSEAEALEGAGRGSHG